MLKQLLKLFWKPKTIQKETPQKQECWVQLTLPLK